MRSRLQKQYLTIIGSLAGVILVFYLIQLWRDQIRRDTLLEFRMLQMLAIQQHAQSLHGSALPPAASAAVPAAAAAATAPDYASEIAAAAAASADQLQLINGVKPFNLPEWHSDSAKPYYLHPKSRSDKNISVTIVVVVLKDSPMERYTTAKNSVECYAALHGYNLAIFYDDKYEACKKHLDFFFRRHCNVHLYMKEKMKEDDYMLFIDGDMGVVNPNKLIEDYISPEYDIYLYDRFWNWEYAACSYMVRNNELGRAWVRDFGEFEFQQPNSHTGTDNGSLHPYLMYFLVPNTKNAETRSRMSSLCINIWNASKNYDDVFAMESCVRAVIGERLDFPEKRTKIYQKGFGWGRDLWTLHSHWTTDDLMVHSVKEENLKKYPTNETERQACHASTLLGSQDGNCGCIFPVLNKLNVDKCKKGTESWYMEGRLQLSVEDKKKILNTMAFQIMRGQMNAFAQAAGKIKA